MNYIVKYVAIISIITTVASCAPNRFESILEDNSSPLISLNKGELDENGVWKLTERFKIGLKTGKIPISINVKGEDPEGFNLTVDVNKDEEVEIFDQNNTPLEFPLQLENSEEASFFLSVENTGLYEVDIILTDELGKTSLATITIDAFINEIPVAVINPDPRYIGVASRNEYEIIGSGSYDNDQAWGGSVSYYEWTINNSDEFITETPYFRQSLEPGGYNVTLTVIDNDGVRSEKVSELITIQ